MESFLRVLAQELAQRHELTVLAQRIDNGPSSRLTDSLAPPPTFAPFVDGRVRVKPFRVSPARRLLMAPLLAQVTPGLRRYAYGRSRLFAAEIYARALAPVLAEASRGADVVHMWGHDLVAAAAVRAARDVGAGCAITPFAHEGQWGTDPASAAAYRAAGAVIALSETDAALYRALGAAAAKISVCGVCSPGLAPGGGDDLRRRRGISGPLVAFVGVRRPYKGFDLLLDAAPEVLLHLPEATVAFVGPREGHELGREDSRIIDAGRVDDAELAAWIDAADLLCLPSRGEIFPVTLLEAWSLATPVLTSDLPALVEQVHRSGGGRAVRADAAALTEAIVELLEDKDGLARMGRAGQGFWRQHGTPDAVARCHEAVYSSLATAAGVRAA